jgi:hypothetical protein
MWRQMPVIPEHWRLRHDELKASMGYRAWVIELESAS